MPHGPALTIGQVAARAGVRASRICFYEDVGVMPPAQRVSGHRRCDDDAVRRLAVIDAAQRFGLSLSEIRPVTRPDAAGRADERIRAIAERKLPDVEAVIDRAQAAKRRLEVARSCGCASVGACGLFVDPALLPPSGNVEVAIHTVGPRA